MKVLICGGRNFCDVERFEAFMADYVGSDIVIIQGGARGADRMAKNWAAGHFMISETYEADWNKYGRKAGYIRNQQMLDEGKPDLVIAFPGGRGTRMMIDLAEEAGVKVLRA